MHFIFFRICYYKTISLSKKPMTNFIIFNHHAEKVIKDNHLVLLPLKAVRDPALDKDCKSVLGALYAYNFYTGDEIKCTTDELAKYFNFLPRRILFILERLEDTGYITRITENNVRTIILL